MLDSHHDLIFHITAIDKYMLCQLIKALLAVLELFYENIASTVMFETNYMSSVNLLVTASTK